MKTTPVAFRHSINRSLVQLAFLLALGCFALLPEARGQISPPPGGCSPNFTTAQGCNALNLLTTGSGNSGVGWYALFSNSTGNFNTAVGGGALTLNNADSNTAVGAAALLLNTSGTENTAVGTDAMVFNDTGSNNSALGTFALQNNTTGGLNTANGAAALQSNTTGNANTAIGDVALFSNTSADNNTAIGFGALFANTTGTANTATGVGALQSNAFGHDNTAGGVNALLSNADGNGNTAIGFGALQSNTTDSNTAVGFQALQNNTTGDDNTAIGSDALTKNSTGGGNIALGQAAGFKVTTASRVICIGHVGANVSDSCFIGNIRGVTTTQNNALPVLIDSNGQLGTVSSSRRFKKDIKSMDNASEAIMALKPVTFHFKSDNTNRPEFGLIAEQVAEVNPDLVVRDVDGQIYSVRYDAVNAMLLNEFLKEHKTVQNQQKKIDNLEAELKEQKALIQKVSAQLELSKHAPETVSNNH